MNKKTTYAQLTARIIIFTLLVTVSIAYFYGNYMKNNTVSELSKADAKKTSKLVFESLYSAMARGWSREEMNSIIQRVNDVEQNLQVNVIRGVNVNELFGTVANDFKPNPLLFQALNGEEVFRVNKDNTMEYYFPVIAKQECLKCHTNSKVGDINGVIAIKHPVTDLKISLGNLINFFIIFIIIFSIILFMILYFNFQKYLISPIQSLILDIGNIAESRDISLRIKDGSDIVEISSLQEFFNKMLSALEHQFFTDNLTGLPNRKMLLEKNTYKVFGHLMLINIDRFREINGFYGQIKADKILKEFAQELQKVIPENMILFKLQADEFAILDTEAINMQQFEKLAIGILEKISQRNFHIDNNDINISITIGIAQGDERLLTNANVALKIAKKQKREYLIYEPSMLIEEEFEHNIFKLKELKTAIIEDRIVTLFQPIVDTQTKEIKKYEALVRLKERDGSLTSPFHFLEFSKKAKIYPKLTKIVAEQSFLMFKDKSYEFSINLCVEDILNDDLVNFLKINIRKHNIGEKLVFELVESEGIENFEQVLKFIEDVKKLGCKIAIDDFGTGYSNFEYLMKLKVDYIKIDASMIKNIDKDENSKIITKTINDFAKELGIKTIGEFVYSESVYEKVKALNIDYSQGYLFGEPKEEVV